MGTTWNKALRTIRDRDKPERPAPESELRDAESMLGRALSLSYKTFCRELGSVQWPAQIDSAGAMAHRWVADGGTDHLIYFGSDGSEVR